MNHFKHFDLNQLYKIRKIIDHEITLRKKKKVTFSNRYQIHLEYTEVPNENPDLLVHT